MDPTKNERIHEILDEVRLEVIRRREAARYGDGYEQAVEDEHNRQLGPLSEPEIVRVGELSSLLRELHGIISSMSEIERDQTRFAPLRYVRELAMTRHQLIRLNREMRGVALKIAEIAGHIVRNETERTSANERAAQDLLDLVYERTAVVERLISIVGELESRVRDLEERHGE